MFSISKGNFKWEKKTSLADTQRTLNVESCAKILIKIENSRKVTQNPKNWISVLAHFFRALLPKSYFCRGEWALGRAPCAFGTFVTFAYYFK